MAMENLFATNSNVEMSSSRNLSGTAQLTSISGSIAATIIDAMNADIDSYLDALKASQTDSRSMDSLIESFDCYKEADIEFLHEISEDVIEGMLKSQQSKRSRCKSKTMTLDNYRSMMTAAIAEGLIRKATGTALMDDIQPFFVRSSWMSFQSKSLLILKNIWSVFHTGP